jgi:hypothetical protein
MSRLLLYLVRWYLTSTLEVLSVLVGGWYKRSCFIGGYRNKKSFAPERATGTSQTFVDVRSPYSSEKYC